MKKETSVEKLKERFKIYDYAYKTGRKEWAIYKMVFALYDAIEELLTIKKK